MQHKKYPLTVFAFFLGIALAVFLLGRINALQFLTSTVQNMLFPISSVIVRSTSPQSKSTIDRLAKENAQLLSQLAALNNIKKENQALHDQFQITAPSAQHLLEALVVGRGGSIPNISFPEFLIVDKGSSNTVHSGQAVVSGNNLVGTVTQVSSHYAQITLVSNIQSSLSVTSSQTSALGVAKGQGSGEIIMGDVVLSDTLKPNDTVVTTGSQDISGSGIPPGLIIGKISSIQKNPSSLFQQAIVEPLVPLDHLQTVFINL